MSKSPPSCGVVSADKSARPPPAGPVAPVAPAGIPNANANAPLLAVNVAVAVGVAPADKPDAEIVTVLTLPSSATRLPLESKPSCLLALVETSGNVSDAVVSKSDKIKARLEASSISAAIAIMRSSSVLRVATSKGPDVGKSVVRSRSMSRVITTLDPPEAPVTSLPVVICTKPVVPEV